MRNSMFVEHATRMIDVHSHDGEHFEVYYQNDNWTLQYMGEFGCYGGGTPEKYWDTDVEKAATLLADQIVKHFSVN